MKNGQGCFMFEASVRLPRLLAGDTPILHAWLVEPGWRWTVLCLVTIVLGSGVYGSTLGLWCGPEQALYTAIKFPVVVLFTCAANAALNGCLGQLLGGGMGFRQTTLAILMGFAATSVVLASFAPLTAFLLWNVPSSSGENARIGHGVMLLTQVAVISLAGIAGARRLFRLVVRTSGSVAVARRVFVAWLLGNLLLGAQVSWVLRPFFVTPGKPVEFLRADALDGNFLEGIRNTIRSLFF